MPSSSSSSRNAADIERGKAPSLMEKTITVLSKIFRVKRYVALFFLAWVGFAFVCAHRAEISSLAAGAGAAQQHQSSSSLSSSTARRAARSFVAASFRQDRSVLYKELMQLSSDDAVLAHTCDAIGGNLNVRGIVMFSPTIVSTEGQKTPFPVFQRSKHIFERSLCALVTQDAVVSSHQPAYLIESTCGSPQSARINSPPLAVTRRAADAAR